MNIVRIITSLLLFFATHVYSMDRVGNSMLSVLIAPDTIAPNISVLPQEIADVFGKVLVRDNGGWCRDKQLLHNKKVNSVCFSNDGTKLVTASEDGTACIWNSNSGLAEVVARYVAPINQAFLNSDSTKLITASGFCVFIQDLIDKQKNPLILMHTSRHVEAMVLNKGETELVTLSRKSFANQLIEETWDITNGSITHGAKLSPSYQASCFSLHRQDKFAPSINGCLIHIYDVNKRKVLFTLGHNDTVTQALINKAETKLITASKDCTACIWDLELRGLLMKFVHDTEVLSVFLNESETLLVTVQENNSVCLWDAITGALLSKISHRDSVSNAFLSKDGKELVVACGSKVIIWKPYSLEHALLRKLLYVWLELEKPNKGIKSPQLLLRYIAALFSCNYRQLKSSWSTMPSEMQTKLWEHSNRMITTYGKNLTQEITMFIDLSSKVFCLPRCLDGFFETNLKGFDYGNGQVQLISAQNNPLGMNKMYTFPYDCFPYKAYTSDMLSGALSQGECFWHPLNFHQKTRYLFAHSRLRIDYSSDECIYGRIYLPYDMEKRLLHYLTHDMSCKLRNGFDFFKELFFVSKKCSHKSVPFCNQLQEIDSNATIAFGDGIVLFSKEESQSGEVSIALKHYAIALADNVYISKIGDGGNLYVTNMQALLKLYQCKYYAKVHRSKACLKDFIRTAYLKLPYK